MGPIHYFSASKLGCKVPQAFLQDMFIKILENTYCNALLFYGFGKDKNNHLKIVQI